MVVGGGRDIFFFVVTTSQVPMLHWVKINRKTEVEETLVGRRGSVDAEGGQERDNGGHAYNQNTFCACMEMS